MLKKILLISICLISIAGASNLPRAREATLVEVSSPTELMVRAAGRGVDQKHRRPKAKILDRSANEDAARTAVWFVLYGGSDPLLQTDEEKTAFKEIEKSFYKMDNIRRFIAWEADYYDKRLKTDGGKALKIEKTYKINTALLKEHLVEKSVLKKTTNLAESVGLPSIMVIPETDGDIAPLQILAQDPTAKKAAEVIEAHLTAKQYSVIVPEQQQVLQELNSAQFALAGAEDDYSYLLALSIGSDIYISYNVSITSRVVGNSAVKKAVVACRAYETTTGRLLGTETGYSPERPSAANAVLIEEAMNEAISKVLMRITNYWKNDIKNGIQYKCVFSVGSSFNTDRAEEIIFTLSDICKSISTKLNENTVADYTYDVSMWVDPKNYTSATDIYRDIKRSYNYEGSIRRVLVSRKLILLSVEEE